MVEEFIDQLAGQVGMRKYDLFLVADQVIPDGELLFDEEAGGRLPRLVKHMLNLSVSSRRQVRDSARSMAEAPQATAPRRKRSYEDYPPGYGSLLVRMLALRNLGWASTVRVMHRLAGVSLSPATIGAVGHGVKKLDAELLNGFAVLLGIPTAVLASLIDMRQVVESPPRSAEVVDTAELIWDVRHLSAGQMKELTSLAESLLP